MLLILPGTEEVVRSSLTRLEQGSTPTSVRPDLERCEVASRWDEEDLLASTREGKEVGRGWVGRRSGEEQEEVLGNDAGKERREVGDFGCGRRNLGEEEVDGDIDSMRKKRREIDSATRRARREWAMDLEDRTNLMLDSLLGTMLLKTRILVGSIQVGKDDRTSEGREKQVLQGKDPKLDLLLLLLPPLLLLLLHRVPRLQEVLLRIHSWVPMVRKARSEDEGCKGGVEGAVADEEGSPSREEEDVE